MNSLPLAMNDRIARHASKRHIASRRNSIESAQRL